MRPANPARTPNLAPGLAWPALLNAALILACLVYGFDHDIPPVLRVAAYRLATLPWLGCLVALGWLLRRPHAAPPPWAGPVFCAGQLALTLLLNLPALPGLATAMLVLAGLGALGSWRPHLGYMACLGLGLVLAAASLVYHPIDMNAADMLPVIRWADHEMLAGVNPYQAVYPGPATSTFYYMPLQLLAYLPLTAVGLDPRLLNLACCALSILLVETRPTAWRATARAYLYPVLLSALGAPMMYNGEIWPYWLGSLALAACVLAGRTLLAGLVLGLLVGMRQTALVAAGVLGLGMLRLLPWRQYLAGFSAGALAACALCLPFLLRGHGLARLWFIDGPRSYLPVAAMLGNPGNQISATNLLGAVGLQGLAGKLQILLLLAAAGLAGIPKAPPAWRLLALAGLAETLAMAFNPYLHRYYYINGLLVLALAASARPQRASPPPTR